MAPAESSKRTYATPSAGVSGIRSQTTAAAPFPRAAGMKSWPSLCVPGTAKKQSPGFTARES